MFKASLYLIIIFSLILSCESGDGHDNSAFFSEIEDTDLVCSGVVKSTTPADEATSVSLSPSISVTFCDRWT